MLARRTGAEVSDEARKRIATLKHYPTIDTWRNPLTRAIARRLVEDDWRKTLSQLDFEYRMSATEIAGVRCARYEPAALKHGAPLVLYVHGGGF